MNYKWKHLFTHTRHHIHYKLFWTVVIALITLLVIVISMAFYFATNESYKEMRRSNQAAMEMAQTYMQEKITDYDELLYSLLFDENFVNSLKLTTDDSEIFAARQYMERRMINLFNSNPNNIKQVQTYTIWDERLVSLTDYQTAYHYHEPEWQNLDYEGRFLVDMNQEAFAIKRNVNDFYTRERIAAISLSVKWGVMASAFQMLQGKEEDIILVVNGDGEIVHQPFADQSKESQLTDLAQNDQLYQETFLELESFYAFQQAVHDNIHILKLIPKQSVLASGESIIQFGILIGVIAIFMIIGFSVFFYWKVTRPISVLASEMDKVVHDNFQTTMEIDQNRSDEIAILQRNFVDMIHQLKHLIEIEYKHALEKQQAQYQALQHKINPHFLHNSLQLIGNGALSNEGKQVYRMIQALGEMFRYTLRANKDVVTIDDEIKHLQQYLYIQKQRFQDRLVLDLYVDEEVSCSTIPILTLQPIVENAFSHAFASDDQKWRLSITVEIVLEEVEILIEDNGKGMEPATLQKVLASLQGHHKDLSYVKQSIGLQNVNNRLKIIYGDDYGIHMYSKQGGGTSVLIRIPLILEEDAQ
ncbi:MULTISPECIES: sensor histidine kinase [Gracilibacillus]|uniref:sensor histidine kinase n=1 Tax=Gracilibacillus TaxID=74385 RepID=UPI0008242F36|nr:MULTISPECIES: histidine kinase [Gracilibacillus]